MAATGTTASRWHEFLRRRDLAQIVTENPGVISGPLLEVGAGAGVVTDRLRELAGDVIPTDIAPRAEIEGFVYADAQSLPFDDSQFRCIYSSNVLEHVPNLDAAMSEFKRVMMDDGVMIHSMPTVAWKIIQMLVHPLGALKAVFLNRLGSRTGKTTSHGVDSSTLSNPAKRGIVRRLIDMVVAPVHGVGSNHFDEARRFSSARWNSEFERAGFRITTTGNLFFHSPYRLLPFRLMWLRSLLSKSGLASVRYYVLVSETNSQLARPSQIEIEQ